MIKDQETLEYAISQYLDGTLNTFDRQVLEDRLASDAEARLLASEYAHLDRLLKSSRTLPNIDFDQLAGKISSQIAQEDAYAPAPLRMPGVFVRYTAIAAAVILAIGVGLHFIPGTTTTVADGSIDVRVNVAEVPTSTPSINIVIGPTEQLKSAGYARGIGDDQIITRIPRLVITAIEQPQPTDLRLY
jgi:hypothetical protein